jgi:nucleoid DNA-binding protein
MNTSELAATIAGTETIPKAQARRIVDLIYAEIAAGLIIDATTEENPVRLPGIGTLRAANVPGRTGKAFGKAYASPAHYTVRFHPSSALIARLPHGAATD